MNSIKILVNSLDGFYPSKANFDIKEEDDEREKPEEDVRLYTNDTAHGNAELDQLESVDSQQDGQDGSEQREEDREKAPKENPSGASSNYFLATVWHALLFLPMLLLRRPLVLMWYVILYPFSIIFKSFTWGLPEVEDVSDPHSAQRISEKTALLKQENILANNVKSPTSSSKYIMPPPQRLYPLSRNPGKKRKRKTLILDLDETLIHSLSHGSPRSFSSSSSLAHTVEVRLNNITSLYHVHKRPFCDQFLKEIARWFELQIFTASVKEYADPIINWLESEVASNFVNKQNYTDHTPPKIFTKRYYRNDCTYRDGVGYIKNLSKFFPREEDLRNVILLDNSPVSYALHEDNAIMIEGWINDQGDRDLINLLPMLHSLSLCIDVRYVLSLRQGEKAFEN